MTKKEKIDKAWAEYTNIHDPAHEEYKRIIETAEAKYKSISKQ